QPEQGSAVAVGSGSGTVAAGSGMGSGSGSGSAEAPTPPYPPAADVPQAIKDAIAATDRDADDRRLDAGRKPGEVLAFFHLAPGAKVGELFAGRGYTTELMARIVGPTGKIWAENTKELMDAFLRDPWTKR